MPNKHTFKDLIHEVSLNKDIHDSFSNIFKSCKSDINNKNNSQDLNRSFSCFSNTYNELKFNLDDNINISSHYLKVNLKGKKSNDINNSYNNNIRVIKSFLPNSSSLIYKKK